MQQGRDTRATSGVRGSEDRKSLRGDIEGRVSLAKLANMILAKGRSRTSTSKAGDEELDQMSRVSGH